MHNTFIITYTNSILLNTQISQLNSDDWTEIFGLFIHTLYRHNQYAVCVLYKHTTNREQTVHLLNLSGEQPVSNLALVYTIPFCIVHSEYG